MSEALESVIEDSITDASLPADAPADIPATPDAPPIDAPADLNTEVAAAQVQAPKAEEPKPPVDDFDKRFGLVPNSSSGRENRIPYSRVRKITEKAERDLETKLRGEYTPKVSEYETKVKDYETKITDYEGRLRQVAQVEHMMMNDKVGFLQNLIDRVPGYAQLLAPLYQQAQQQQQQPPQEAQKPAQTEARPDPDVTLADGTKVYSMDGLDKLNAWNQQQAVNAAVAQAEKKVMDQIQAKYGKVFQSYDQYEQQQALLPRVNAQVEAARKWPQFSENEGAIVEALKANPQLSLEGAYRQVVLPKFQQTAQTAQVDKAQLEKDLRAQILAELQSKPRGTSAIARPNNPNAPASTGKRSIESIIEEQIKLLK